VGPGLRDVHIGGVETKELISQILDLLRPGDVLTHTYLGHCRAARLAMSRS
jgi:dihydroorotase